ncbi:hypothetical protein A4X09_0g7646, partial [Tilletia walkeri]
QYKAKKLTYQQRKENIAQKIEAFKSKQ